MIQKTHTARYTGRGLGWARKPITKRRSRRMARYLAGVMIRTAVKEGYLNTEDLTDRFGEDGCQMIRGAVMDYGVWLESTGHPDGRSGRA